MGRYPDSAPVRSTGGLVPRPSLRAQLWISVAFRAVAPEVGRQLRDILVNYLAAYGVEGAYERMRGRSVAQVVAEYRPAPTDLIASGEDGGVQYSLNERPPPSK